MNTQSSYVVTAGLNRPVYYSNQRDAMKAARSYALGGGPVGSKVKVEAVRNGRYTFVAAYVARAV